MTRWTGGRHSGLVPDIHAVAGILVDQFEAHTEITAAFPACFTATARKSDNFEIVRCEHAADDITCDMLQDIHRVFVTPVDRSVITGLTGLMTAIDQMNRTASAIALHDITDFASQMVAMSDAGAVAGLGGCRRYAGGRRQHRLHLVRDPHRRRADGHARLLGVRPVP